MKSKKQESKDRYLKEEVETFVVRVPKGRSEIINQRATEVGKSRNCYINDLIKKDIGEE